MMATETDLTKIKERIRKLMALGTSANEAEASAAISKAESLLAEYELTHKDLGDSRDVVDEFVFCYGRSDGELTYIAKILETHFKIRYYLISGPDPRGKVKGLVKHIHFLGKPHRVEVAIQAFLLLRNTIHSSYQVWMKDIEVLYKKRGFSSVGHAKKNKLRYSYFQGFLGRVYTKLEESTRKNQETGLVLLSDPDTEAYAEELNIQKVVVTKKYAQDLARDAYYQGASDGENFEFTPGLKDKF